MHISCCSAESTVGSCSTDKKAKECAKSGEKNKEDEQMCDQTMQDYNMFLSQHKQMFVKDDPCFTWDILTDTSQSLVLFQHIQT